MKCKAIELTSLNSEKCIVKLVLFINYQVQWSKFFKHWRLMVNQCWVNIFNGLIRELHARAKLAREQSLS